MIIKITSPLQAELQVGDELEMHSSSGLEKFEVLSVQHFANGVGSSTDVEFELDSQNVNIPALTLFRTPYCTWALRSAIMRSQAQASSFPAAQSQFMTEYSGVPMPMLQVDESKIISKIAELVKWPRNTLPELEKLIFSLGEMIIEEVLAPVVKFAEENLVPRDEDQFYRLTRDMFQGEMLVVEQKFLPVKWTKGPRRDEESVLYMTKKKINPVATRIIQAAGRKYGPKKRTISRANAPWDV